MHLFDIPSQVWQRILLQWILLPELVRFDLAGLQPQLDHPLLSLYSGHHLVNSSKDTCLERDKLAQILDWMRSRNVFLKQFRLGPMTSPMWLQLFEWTGMKVQNLTLVHVLINENMLALSVVHCASLIELSLKWCSMGCKNLHAVLSKNATSLKKLELRGVRFMGETWNNNGNVAELPQLKLTNLVLVDSEVIVLPILSACSQLTHLGLQDTPIDESVAQRIVASHRTLKSLVMKLARSTSSDNTSLLPFVLEQCVHVQRLEIRYLKYSIGFGRDGLLHKLTNLTFLALDTCSDRVLNDIGTQSFPALCTMGIGYSGNDDEIVTTQGIRQLTKNCPNLTALSLRKLKAPPDGVSSSTVLQYCAKLQYLEICELGVDHLEDAIVKSAAKYCPLLHTLNMNICYTRRPNHLNLLVRSCKQLRTLVICPNWKYKVTDNNLQQRVTVVTEYPFMATWKELKFQA